jgi:hypothetical protein
MEAKDRSDLPHAGSPSDPGPRQGRIWILCANEMGARLFECASLADDGIRLARELPVPARSLLPGLAQAGEGPRALRERVSEAFAAHLGRQLGAVLLPGSAARLILAADSPFLERLEAALPGAAKAALIGSVPQDLYLVNESDLVSYVRDFVSGAEAPGRRAA